MIEKKTIAVSCSEGNIEPVFLERLKNAYRFIDCVKILDRIDSADYTVEINFPILHIRETWDKENIMKFLHGCDTVIHLASTFTEAICDVHSMLEISKACGVKKFIYVLVTGVHGVGKSADITRDSALESLTDCSSLKIPSEDYLRKAASGNFNIITIVPVTTSNCSSWHKLDLAVNTFTKNSARNSKISLFGQKRGIGLFHIKDKPRERIFQAHWYKQRCRHLHDSILTGIADLCLHLLVHSTEKIGDKTWSHIVTYRIYLQSFFVTRKLLEYLADPRKFIHNIKSFIVPKIKRLIDVTMMMFLLHFWPEQTYRFSTRKLLPNKDRRYRAIDRSIIPLKIVESRTSDIQRMKDVNIVLRGTSFDIEQLEKLDSPIFLANFMEPIPTKKDVTYTVCDIRNALRLSRLGCKVIYIDNFLMDDNGDISPAEDNRGAAYKQLEEEGVCERIAIIKNVCVTRSATPGWTPFGGLLAISALYHFAEKINVYGWDFYFESSPDTMNYWQLFFNLYKLKLDLTRSRSHLEMAMITFYYGYHLSKLPNVNIYGRMGQLGKHEKLIKKIEKVLFN